MRSKGLEPLKTRQYVDLLKDWGFTLAEHGGRHPIMLTPDGLTRFPLSTPGKVTSVEVRRAARLLGVSRRDFLAGPPKTRPPKPTPDMRAVQMKEIQERYDTVELVLPEPQPKEKEMAKVIEQPKSMGRPRDPNSTAGRVRQFFTDNPTGRFTSTEVAEALGLTVHQVSVPLSVAQRNGMLLRDPESRTYRLYVAPEKPVKSIGKQEWVDNGDGSASSNGHKDGNVRNKVLAFMEEHADRPITIDMAVDSLGTIRSSTAAALLALYRLGCIEQVARGVYRFNTPSFVGTIGHGDVSVVRGPAPGGSSDGTPEGVLLSDVSSAGVPVPGVPEVGPEPGGRTGTGSGDLSDLRGARDQGDPQPGSPGTPQPGRTINHGERAAGSSSVQSPEGELGRLRTSGFTARDEEPIDLIPATTMWEQVKNLADGRVLLQDDTGGLWVAQMTRLEV